MTGKTAVIALGGNALIKDENHQTIVDQLEAVGQSCAPIASLITHGWKVAITHGNGPQIGFILLRSEIASRSVPTVPLDVCGAQTQGEIGYLIQQSLQNELKKRGTTKPVATVATQVVVDEEDIAFKNPSKPIGPFYEKNEAEQCKRKHGWEMMEDAGRGWRRLVPSPTPLRIVELEVIQALIRQGTATICLGGGGIPVIQDADGLRGVEAVIDKDLSSALLAIGIKADLFLILTSVHRVALNYGKSNEKWIKKLGLKQAERYLEEGHFPSGSMGPKIQAAINYLKNNGKRVLITSPDRAESALLGETGTWMTR